MQCQKRDCPRKATHAIQLGIGGIADPDEAPPRCKLLLGVLLCEECLEEETADKWLACNGDTLRPLATVSMSPVPPDFDRAVVLGVSLESPEYQNLVLQGLNSPKAN